MLINELNMQVQFYILAPYELVMSLLASDAHLVRLLYFDRKNKNSRDVCVCESEDNGHYIYS